MILFPLPPHSDRDEHMAETLAWLCQIRPGAKIVVWAHNSHLGDARAAEMSAQGERNVGQLTRERFGDDFFLIGFTTHSGEVTAASQWKAPQKGNSFVRRWKELMKRSFTRQTFLLLFFRCVTVA